MRFFVKLKTPDATAITAFKALKRMGFAELRSLDRLDYYDFNLENDISHKLKACDLLVNANKHLVLDSPPDGTKLLVKDKDSPDSLLNTLKNRLGFNEIRSMSKGTLWVMDLNSSSPEDIATDIADALLYNRFYQNFEFL